MCSSVHFVEQATSNGLVLLMSTARYDNDVHKYIYKAKQEKRNCNGQEIKEETGKAKERKWEEEENKTEKKQKGKEGKGKKEKGKSKEEKNGRDTKKKGFYVSGSNSPPWARLLQ